MATLYDLEVKLGSELIKTLPLEGPVLIGRSDSCQIKLTDQAVSRVHALIRLEGGAIELEKKSQFGLIKVNGLECQRANIKPEDAIMIGPYLLVLQPKKKNQSNLIQAPDSTKLAPTPLGTALLGPTKIIGGTLAGGSQIGGIEGELQQRPHSRIQQTSELQMPSTSGGATKSFFVQGDPSKVLAQDQVAPAGSMDFTRNPQSSVQTDGQTSLISSEKVLGVLELAPGAAQQSRFEWTQEEFILGRGKQCDVVLNDKKASRQNTIIRRSSLRFSIKDLNSANGTFLNGEPLSEQELFSGDKIQIGDTEIIFTVLSQGYDEKQRNFMPIPVDKDQLSQDMGSGFGAPAVASNPGTPSLEVQTPWSVFQEEQVSSESKDAKNVASSQGLSIQGLLEKYRQIPPDKRRLYWIVVVIAAFVFLDDDETGVGIRARVLQKAPKSKVAARAVNSASPQTSPSTVPTGPPGFATLPLETQKQIETAHQMAFEYYKNKDYDQALFQLQKIFSYLPNFKDAREIERYAQEGKRKLEAIEQEKQKKDQEEKLKRKIASLVEQCSSLMSAHAYPQARELFTEILTIDPENTNVSAWRVTIEAFEEQERSIALQKEVERKLNEQGVSTFNEGLQARKEKHYFEAIDLFHKVLDSGVNDPKLIKKSKNMIQQSKQDIINRRTPILNSAIAREKAGKYNEAIALFEKVSNIDPYLQDPYDGIKRIKMLLHDKAKRIYTEAILSESYSDFANAEAGFKTCLQSTLPDDLYYHRCYRKLSNYWDVTKNGVTPPLLPDVSLGMSRDDAVPEVLMNADTPDGDLSLGASALVPPSDGGGHRD